jgi:arylsulfatase A-like enzyme
MNRAPASKIRQLKLASFVAFHHNDMFHFGVRMKQFLTSVLIISGAAMAVTSCHSREPRSHQKIQKVLLISIDTLRADYLSCYDPQKKTSPNIDRFADDNILFEYATSQGPSTAISHKSILYSLYPAIHKTTKDTVPTETSRSPLEILQSKGFKTAAFVGGGQLSRKFGFARGFDSYWEAAGTRKKGKDRFNLQAIEMKTDEWLDHNYKNNFFLFVHTYEVHCPYNPPEKNAQKFTSWYQGSLDPNGKCGDNYYNVQPMSPDDMQYVRGLYSGSVNFVDEFIGRLIQKLKNLNIYDQTMIVFLADHGESLGERSYVGHNLDYEIQLHVPLIMHIPGYDNARIDQPVIGIDVMPTIFDVLGLGRAFPFQGRSLIPVVDGTTEIERDRVLIAEQKDRIRVRKEEWVCIFSRVGPPREELYNVKEDPEELNNLAEKNPEKVAEFKRFYGRMLESSKDISAKFILGPQSGPELDEATKEQLKALGYVGE